MSDDRNLLMQAKQLIDEQRYEEARSILQSMPDNETAQNWLARLNERAPMGASSDQPKRNMPDVKFEGTIPMIPQVTAFIQDMVIARVGMMGAIALVLAVVFGITGAIELTYIRAVDFKPLNELNIVYVFVLTLVTAVNFYALSYMLSMAFPQLERNHLLGLVAFASGISLIAGFLQYNGFFAFGGKESILSWILTLVLAGGVTYLLSSKNTQLTSAGGPKLSGDNLILFFIGFIMLRSTAAILAWTPIIGDPSTFIAGLVSGMVLGALTGTFTYIVLKKAE